MRGKGFSTALPAKAGAGNCLVWQRDGAQGHVARQAPQVARVTRIELRRRPALGWCWQIDGKVRPTAETAEAVLGKLRERVERELRPKSWEP